MMICACRDPRTTNGPCWYTMISVPCTVFDRELTADLRKMGGEKYASVATLAYRQAIAAHKLAVDIDALWKKWSTRATK